MLAPTNGSVFGLPGAESWLAYLYAPTPVHQGASGRYYKREDWFAPLGYGGPNGSKLRQLLILLHAAWEDGAAGVLTAASVHSPQIPMTAAVCRYLNLPLVIVIGGTNLVAARRHPGVAYALELGAEVRCIAVGYNPALQAHLATLAASEDFAGWYRLPYAISCPADASRQAIHDFHEPGAHQVASLPPDVTRIIMPFGSGNSAATVLYGLARFETQVQSVKLVGIGPSRANWLLGRLEALGVLDRYASLPEPGSIHLDLSTDLHEMGLFHYGQPAPWALDGIAFHPTYEGHVVRYLETTLNRDWHSPGTLFWIVGSQQTAVAS